MFWEINILVPTYKELQNFRKSKDRDKTFILCKQLKYSLEICCCIMSELEIHVSTPLRGINSVEVSVCSRGRSGDHSCRKLIVDVCNGPGAPSARIVEPDQMDQASMKMKLAAEDESGVDDEILDEDMDPFRDDLPLDMSSSRPETPITTGTSPPIPIPRLSPIGTGGFIGTPTRSSSFSHFYRFSSPEETSPMSSGYGSAPRFFQSTSTQTPPLSPVLLETSISLRLFETDTDSTMTPQEQVRLRRQRYCEESRRTRFYSEGSESVPPPEPVRGDEAIHDPLPDVVAFRRSRANSAPARPVAPEIATGRELRRIGDEFVAFFEGQRSLKRNASNRRSLIRRLFDSLSTTNSPISESAPARTSSNIRDGSSV